MKVWCNKNSARLKNFEFWRKKSIKYWLKWDVIVHKTQKVHKLYKGGRAEGLPKKLSVSNFRLYLMSGIAWNYLSLLLFATE